MTKQNTNLTTIQTINMGIMKKIVSKIELQIMKLACKAIFMKETVKVKDAQNTNYSSFMLAISLFTASLLFYCMEDAFATITGISDIKVLGKKVQDEIQNHAVPIVLNAAGISCAGFAIITQKWTMLFLGVAYLVFVNVFFGFVNSAFKIS